MRYFRTLGFVLHTATAMGIGVEVVRYHKQFFAALWLIAHCLAPMTIPAPSSHDYAAG